MTYSTSLKLWNKLTFSGLLDVRKGGQVWNGTRGILTTRKGEGDDRSATHQRPVRRELSTRISIRTSQAPALASSRSPAPSGSRGSTNNGGGFGPVGQQFVEDGSFVKLRELSLTYTLDSRGCTSLTVLRADIRIAGRNLHTWTQVQGLRSRSQSRWRRVPDAGPRLLQQSSDAVVRRLGQPQSLKHPKEIM